MLKATWSVDKFVTLKSYAAVTLLGVAVVAGFLIIRVVGEKRLERFLKIIFCFRRKESNRALTAEVLVSDNRT